MKLGREDRPYAVGLMSGTSLDGVDAALVDFRGEKPRLVQFLCLPIPDGLRGRILACCSLKDSNIQLACSLNVELGELFASAAVQVCKAADVRMEQVQCIASHGQTVYHIPESRGGLSASTLQLGEPAVIAARTGAAVVSSLRAADMAAGGRGAPLVPYADYLLFAGETSRALQNIGGIGNVTVLPAGCSPNEVFAFDTGPGNMVIDSLARRLFSLPFDKGGRLAAAGRPVLDVLNAWMAEPFLHLPPPKATGRELFGEQFVENALQAFPDIAPHDWLATAAQFTAATIAQSYRDFVFPHCRVSEVILSGGGSRNLTLVDAVRRELPGLRVIRLDELGMDPDAKEAVAFAILGRETMLGRPGNLPKATGARKAVVLGSITPAN